MHLDDSKGCAKRVDAAVRLAGQHGAHLTGFYPIVEIPLLKYIRVQIPPEIQANIAAEAKARADAGPAAFRTAAECGGIAYEARTDHALDTTLASVVSMHARYAEVVVLGPGRSGRSASCQPPLARASRAVVQAAGVAGALHRGARTFRQRIVVAGDASREAARAVSDAMPMLNQAASVLRREHQTRRARRSGTASCQAPTLGRTLPATT